MGFQSIHYLKMSANELHLLGAAILGLLGAATIQMWVTADAAAKGRVEAYNRYSVGARILRIMTCGREDQIAFCARWGRISAVMFFGFGVLFVLVFFTKLFR